MTEPTYWFPAKRAGLGWGLPQTWEGWVVVGAFVALLVAGRYVLPREPRWRFSVYAVALVVALLGVMYFKGEPLGH